MTGIITSIPPTVELPPGSSTAGPTALPGVTYVAAIPTLPQTWTGLQTFTANSIQFAGSTSGNTFLNATAIASGTVLLPAIVGSDTLLTNNNVATVTNKSIDGLQNTITNVPSGALDPDLQAIAALTGTGILSRTAADTWALRTLTGTANEITVTNGDGVAGAPTASLPAALTFTGKTVTGGTFNGPAIFGGTAAGSALTLQSTSNVSPSGDSITFQASAVTLRPIGAGQITVNIGIANVASGLLTLAGSASGATTLSPSAAASGTLTLPAATDTLVGKATTDTLTNKTLTTPVINGLPTGTGIATANTVSTLVARDVSGNFSAGTITAALSGNATSATSATNTTNSAITNDTATNATMFPAWVTANTGNLPLKVTSTKLTFNPSTGVLSSTSFTGAGTGLTGTAASLTAGNVTTNANLTGDVTSVGNASTIAANAVTNAKMATMAAYTIKANATGSSAVPTDVSIPALTQKVSPVSGDILLIADSAASNALKFATVGSIASAGSVSSLNGATGAISLSVVKQAFTASGTYTPTTGMKYCIIECIGGGGGGGGVAGSGSNNFCAGGGGSGGYSRKVSTAAAIGASQTVTIGASGAGGASGANNGSAGGDTSVGTICIAKGGSGGSFVSAGNSNVTGGAGGVAGTGDLTPPGSAGQTGMWSNQTGVVIGVGMGGASFLGGAPLLPAVTNSAATAGPSAVANTGAGGSGANAIVAAANAAGGAGGSGVVFITEFVIA